MKRAVQHQNGSITITLSEADKANLWIAVREGRRALAGEYASYDCTFELSLMHELARKGFGKAQPVVTAHTERCRGAQS